MTTTGTHLNHWTLMRRPYRNGILTVLICFILICLISAPHSPLEFAVCAICTLGYVFLFDCFREFVYPAALRFLNWSLFFALAFLFALACFLAVDYAGKHFGIALTFTRPVQFMIIAAAGGAIGSMIVKRSKHNEKAAA